MSTTDYRLMLGNSPVTEVFQYKPSVIDGQPLIHLAYEVDGETFPTAIPVASTDLVFKKVTA